MAEELIHSEEMSLDWERYKEAEDSIAPGEGDIVGLKY